MTLSFPKCKSLRAVLQLALGAGVLIAIVAYANWLITIDPFARYRPSMQQSESLQQVGVRMEDVDFTLYDGKSEIATCHVDRIDIRRDRQQFEMVGITDGQMTSKDGSFEFESKWAKFEQRTKVLSALQGARVWNKDIDLTAQGFTYYQRIKRLQTLGTVTGKFYGGTILAENLIYDPVAETASAGPIAWTGDLTKFAQDTPGIDANSRKPWEIKGEKFAQQGDVRTFRVGRATDGEVILLADLIEHNKATDVVTATGNVRYFSSKSNMNCEKAVVFRKEKRAVLTGNVTMLVKPKDQEKLEEAVIPPFRPIVPESISSSRPTAPPTQDKSADEEVRQNNLRKYPTQIWAERIEYWYQRGTRRAVVTGSPQARQDLPGERWRHVWTFRGEFDAEAEKLRLLSSTGKNDTRLKTSIGDDLRAKWLLISTKEGGEDELEGEDVQGTVVSDDEDLNNRTSKPPPASKPPLRGSIGA